MRFLLSLARPHVNCERPNRVGTPEKATGYYPIAFALSSSTASCRAITSTGKPSRSYYGHAPTPYSRQCVHFRDEEPVESQEEAQCRLCVEEGCEAQGRLRVCHKPCTTPRVSFRHTLLRSPPPPVRRHSIVVGCSHASTCRRACVGVRTLDGRCRRMSDAVSGGAGTFRPSPLKSRAARSVVDGSVLDTDRSK